MKPRNSIKIGVVLALSILGRYSSANGLRCADVILPMSYETAPWSFVTYDKSIVHVVPLPSNNPLKESVARLKSAVGISPYQMEIEGFSMVSRPEAPINSALLGFAAVRELLSPHEKEAMLDHVFFNVYETVLFGQDSKAMNLAKRITETFLNSDSIELSEHLQSTLQGIFKHLILSRLDSINVVTRISREYPGFPKLSQIYIWSETYRTGLIISARMDSSQPTGGLHLLPQE